MHFYQLILFFNQYFYPRAQTLSASTLDFYIKKGFINRQMKWYLKYGQWIKVKNNPAYQITEFHFFSSKDEEIKL